MRFKAKGLRALNGQEYIDIKNLIEEATLADHSNLHWFMTASQGLQEAVLAFRVLSALPAPCSKLTMPKRP